MHSLREHLSRVTIYNESIFDWKRPSKSKWGFVIALELLDNLPHDKLVFRGEREILETRVKIEANEYSEEFHPVSDSIIKRHLSYLSRAGLISENWNFKDSDFSQDAAVALVKTIEDPTFSKRFSLSDFIRRKVFNVFPIKTQQRSFYIPTGAQLFLETCHKNFPSFGLLMADFDSLPGAMPGVNGPLVQQTKGNSTIELSSYLIAELGAFDVLFPTNFSYLKLLYDQIYSANPTNSSSVMKTAQFMRKYANYKRAQTLSGYNPLLTDFVNTSFFVAAPRVQNAE